MLLAHRKVPVVPVTIRGTHDAWPPSRRLPKCHPVSVTFLPPIRSEAIPGENGKDAAEQIVERLFATLSESLDDGRR